MGGISNSVAERSPAKIESMTRRLALALVWLLTPASAQLPRGWLWHDPGNVAAPDFAGPLGASTGLPKPPFTFLREDLSGTQPKLFAKDAAGSTWNVKFGYEVRSESFCWRMVHACGYFAEANFRVVSGQFQGFRPMKRMDPTLHPDGRFTEARFQFRDANLKFLDDRNWRWDRPPFGGTKELSGLKILIMLFSNYDNKDGRVGRQFGPNTAIFELKRPTGMEYIYAFTDWGSGLGRMGPMEKRDNWDCAAFAEQSKSFVKKVEKTQVIFGYDGNVNEGFQTGIPPAHVAWLMQYLGKISDAQLRAGLQASGASDADAACFTSALRMRIEQLRAVK